MKRMSVQVHPRGEYVYSRGSRFAAHGVASRAGFGIERGRFGGYLPWKQGFAEIERHLASLDRPLAALCGIELRMPKPLAFEEFRVLNDRYLEQLDGWSLLIDGESPFCRTNVAPTASALEETCVAAFSYAVPCAEDRPVTFVLSGAAELPLDAPFPDGVVRRGETGADAMVEKAATVADLIGQHLASLNLTWDASADVHLYAAHDVVFATMRDVLGSRGVTPNMGLVWHDAAPPTHEIALEMDVRTYLAERLIGPRG